MIKKNVMILSVISMLLFCVMIINVYADKGKSSPFDVDSSVDDVSDSMIKDSSVSKVEMNDSADNKIKEEENLTAIGKYGNEYNIETRTEIKNKGNESQLKIKVKGVSISSDVEVEQDGNSLRAKLSNGKEAEIKVMPSTASQTAIERLGTKGVEISLKETGNGNNLSVVYEVEGNKTVKFLGLFKVQTEVKAVISAENGEVLRLEKPWWYFLAFKNGVVDCDENNLDLCDDETECLEMGLIWFNNSCVNSCNEDTFMCDDNVTLLSRNLDLNCEFDISTCPIEEIIQNETSTI